MCCTYVIFRIGRFADVYCVCCSFFVRWVVGLEGVVKRGDGMTLFCRWCCLTLVKQVIHATYSFVCE